MQAKLVVVGGDAKATEIRLKLPSIIGRGREASLTLPHPLVSRQHCEILEANGQLLVRDLGSLNGTFVGNEKITEAVLPPGELLTVGTVTFRAVYEIEPHIEPPSVTPNDHQPKKGDKTVTVPVTGTVDMSAFVSDEHETEPAPRPQQDSREAMDAADDVAAPSPEVPTFAVPASDSADVSDTPTFHVDESDDVEPIDDDLMEVEMDDVEEVESFAGLDDAELDDAELEEAELADAEEDVPQVSPPAGQQNAQDGGDDLDAFLRGIG